MIQKIFSQNPNLKYTKIFLSIYKGYNLGKNKERVVYTLFQSWLAMKHNLNQIEIGFQGQPKPHRNPSHSQIDDLL